MDISDDELFKEPPARGECQICLLPMPNSSGVCGVEIGYVPCCGKILCYGCITTSTKEMNEGRMKPWCAFCRVHLPETDNDILQQFKKRIELNDAEAFYMLGYLHSKGDYGLAQDLEKTMKLWNKAAELGSANAHFGLAKAYFEGNGVERDMKPAVHHIKLAAIGGHEKARYTLGMYEEVNGNIERAMKHLMIAARSGYDDALKEVGKGYKAGLITKDEYARTLRAYQCCRDEMKSEQRSKALKDVNFS